MAAWADFPAVEFSRISTKSITPILVISAAETEEIIHNMEKNAMTNIALDTFFIKFPLIFFLLFGNENFHELLYKNLNDKYIRNVVK
jgi:hypothetical protein